MLGKTLSFDVNTKLSLAKAVEFCKIHSRTFESQCTKMCKSAEYSSVRLSSGPKKRVLHSFSPASRKSLFQYLTKFTLGTVSFWETVKWSICELLSYSVFSMFAELNTCGWISQYFFLWISIPMNIFQWYLLKSGRYENKCKFVYLCYHNHFHKMVIWNNFSIIISQYYVLCHDLKRGLKSAGFRFHILLMYNCMHKIKEHSFF